MIRVNLLGVDRAKSRRAPLFDPARRVALGCGLVLVIAVALIGGWYWSLAQASARVDAELAFATQETMRLRAIMAQVQQFEERRQQLQMRVALIEQLRGGQSIPVQMLDIVSRSVPDMLWLTDLDQQRAEVTIQGRTSTLIALSDFVGNLGGGGFFKPPIEIIDSKVESVPSTITTGTPTDVIKFTVRAQLATPPFSGAPATSAGARPNTGPAPSAARR